MAQYLRDSKILNVTITESLLEQIDHLLKQRAIDTNLALDGTGMSEAEKQEHRLSLSYIVRFDDRGYRLNDANEALRHYQRASDIERVIFTLDSARSENTNHKHGTYFEVRLDSKNADNCYVQASSEDSDVVDAVFNGLIDILKKAANRNGIARNTWTQLLVQIVGVALGFIMSLVAAIKIAPQIEIENAFVITFIFAFLIFSNAWGFIHAQAQRLLAYSFPNVRFARSGKESWHWLVQTLIGGLLVALFIFIFTKFTGWLGSVLSSYVAGG
ncbi:hypothetical protein [Solimonas terrae]|uniref:Uncharacterized protein n=1 Tax=Solimonas terrae TaxID=1396819 RepID=A0A6M2BQ47_9GAMM|nr:hypothetical protein [Solimonas terrae]NGY04732.1 hypothetical protein [Solimonas terrae]